MRFWAALAGSCMPVNFQPMSALDDMHKVFACPCISKALHPEGQGVL